MQKSGYNTTVTEQIETPVGIKYSDTYIESCFFVWYANRGKTKFHMADGFPPSEEGNTPTLVTVIKWRDNLGWIERADAMDGELSRTMEKDAIKMKAEAIKKLAKVAETLVDEGIEFIKEKGFDTSSAAVRAVVSGAELMARFVGMGELMLGISKMSDSQVEKELYSLLGKNENEDGIVDAEIQVDDDAPDKPEDDNI